MQINYGAFGDCKQLARVTGGQNLKYIYRYAFRYAPITGFPFGSDLRFVSNEAFFGCGFTPSYPSYLDEQVDGYYKYDGTLSVEAQVSYAKAFEVLDLVNQERAKQGLSALAMDTDLLAVAMQRAARDLHRVRPHTTHGSKVLHCQLQDDPREHRRGLHNGSGRHGPVDEFFGP